MRLGILAYRPRAKSNVGPGPVASSNQPYFLLGSPLRGTEIREQQSFLVGVVVGVQIISSLTVNMLIG
jgi:hypothetical protein